MENKTVKKESKRVTAKTLIEKGKKQGSLTLGEIMEAIYSFGRMIIQSYILINRPD